MTTDNYARLVRAKIKFRVRGNARVRDMFGVKRKV